MLVLALDTTTRAGSVAVVRGRAVLSEVVGDAAITHGARLPADLMRALEAASVSINDVELLAVAAGPGSFTGLRVGIATMQGLATATGLRIVPVSTLDALARAGANDRLPVAAWMDAQRGEVFAGLYDHAGVTRLIDPTSLRPADTLAHWHDRLQAGSGGVRFIGDGAVRYASILREQSRGPIDIVDPPPLAPLIGQLAAALPDRAVEPHAVVPIYIRKPDAELARARQREETRDAR